MKTILNVLLYSSENKEKISLTVKSLLVLLVPIAIHYYGIDYPTANGMVDGVLAALQALLGALGLLGASYGAIRKILCVLNKTADTL